MVARMVNQAGGWTVHGWMERRGAARAALQIVIALVAVNTLYNIIMLLMGAHPPHIFFAMDGDPMFEDFFKYVEGFPGGRTVRPTIVPGMQYFVWLGYHRGFPDTLAGPWPTHFHNPPLTILYGLVTIAIMQVFDPGVLFVGTLALLGWWGWRVTRSVEGDRAVWARLLLLSYPTMVAVARANLFAIACAILVVHAMLLVARGRAPLLAALLLAVAVNLRPNAILFVGPLLVTTPSPWRPALLFVAVGAGLFAASMVISNAFYPAYSWRIFGLGLAHYYQLYVVGNSGLAYGSSMFGGLKLLFGWSPGLDRLALAPPAVLALASAWAWWRRRLTPVTTVFLTAAIYVTASTVIADYHLLVFLVVPMLLADRRDGAISRAEAVALVASALILAPKNEVFVGPVSVQVLLNPLILLAAGAAVVTLSLRPARARMEPTPAPAPAQWSLAGQG